MTEPDILLRRIEDLVRKRSNTDRRMGYVWMLVPILPIFVVIGLAVSFARIVISSSGNLGSIQMPEAAIPFVAQLFALYGLAIISLYSILLIGSLALYYLIDRRNNHFRRQQQLFETLWTYLFSLVGEGARENVSKLFLLSEDSSFEEHDRPAGLWATLFLFVTPIVGLVTSYNLTHDLRRHDERQSEYQAALANALSEAHVASPTFPPITPKRRDAILFLILTAITGGLFWIYWFYTLLKDYNEHFQEQGNFEDQLLTSLKPRQPSVACPSCGGLMPEGAKFCPFCGRPESA